MFLTNDEMRLIREAVEAQAGFDQELIQRCSNLIHIRAFDEAVRNAFVLLEDRMHKILRKEHLTGYQMAQFAFSTNGPFTKLLSHNQLEFEGTRDLFFGAFRLFRNPVTHTIVGYSAGEARSILSLVNLLLIKLDKLADKSQPGILPANVESTLALLEKQVGTSATDKLRSVLSQCIKLNIHPGADAKQWIPFRKYALVKTDQGKDPKSHPVTLFYLTISSKEQGLWFPVRQYYSQIVGIDTDRILEALQELGFKPIGKIQDPFTSLTLHHSSAFLDSIFEIIQQISKSFDESLKNKR